MSNIPLSERSQWVGASESAALFDLSPYTTRFKMYHQKKGNLPMDELDELERIQAGQFLEPSIAAWAAHKWGWPVRNVPNYLAHPSVERMGCSLDFETEDGDPVEIKNVDWLIFRDGDWVSEDDIIYDCPAHFLVQVQHQLACRPAAPRGWLVVCVGGNKLYRMEIPRHDEMIARIEAEVADFWDDFDNDRDPPPDYTRDHSAISKLFTGENEVADLKHDVEGLELCREYKQVMAVEREAKARKSEIMARLKVMSGDARVSIFDEGFSLKASFIRERTSVVREHWRFSLNQSKNQE